MKGVKTLLIVIFIAAAVTGAIAQTSKSLAVVKSFYAYDHALSQTFSRKVIEARKPWISTELYNLFLYELKREAAYLKKNPTDKPYFGDGLPFRPIDETCKIGKRSLSKGLSVRFESGTGRSAVVQAIFAFPAPCKDPDTTTYKIQLVKENSNWRIDDAIYEDNHGLKQDLKRKDY